MTSTKEAKPNYTDEQVEILKAYKPGDDLTALAAKVGKRVPSVRAKLVSMKLYVAPDKGAPAADKDDGPTKKEILAEIEAKGFDTEGFDGATKAALGRLRDILPAVEAQAE